MSIDIRPLTDQDTEAYWRLRLESLEREPHAFRESVEEHRATTLELTAARLRSGSSAGNFVLGAFAGNELAGMVGFVRDQNAKSRHKGRVWGVYVRQQWRGQRIGHALLSELIRRAESEPGLEQIMLTVAAGQTAASRLYSSLGFQIYGREPKALKVGDTYVDEDQMILCCGADDRLSSSA